MWRAAWFLGLAAALVLVAQGVALPTGANQGLDLRPEEQVLLSLINEHRSRNGLTPLTPSPALIASAGWLAQDMAAKNYFGHVDSLGRDLGQRMAALGYNYNAWKGENLAAGSSDPKFIFELWRSSPGHNDNLLSSNYKMLGIGSAFNESSTYKWYWVLDLGGFADVVAGSQGTPPATALASGWNNIAYIGVTRPPDQALASIAGKYRSVFYWDALTAQWLFYLPTAPPSFNNLTSLETFKSYWLDLTEPATMTFPINP